MQPPSLPRPLTCPFGWSGAAAVIAGAAMGALVGARVACALASWLLDAAGCVPTGAPTGALVGTLLALVALPLLGQGTRRAEHAAHRPAPTTTTAAQLVWLAVAAALGRWLAEAPLHPQMGLEGVAWMALLPVVLVAASGLAMAAQGLMRRRGWARWAAVVAFSLVGVTALVQLVDWFRALVRSRTHGWGWGPAPIDLVTQVLFLTISVGVVVLLMTSATSRDFRSSSQPPAGTNGRNSVVATTTPLLALAPRRPGRRRRPPQTRPRLPATASTTERAVLASAVQGRCWNRSTTASAASAL